MTDPTTVSRLKQPMAGVTILFALGVGLGRLVPASPSWIAISALLAAVASLHGFRHPSGWLSLSLVLAGWARFAGQTAVLSPFDLRESTPESEHLTTLHGTLIETPQLRLQGIASRRSTNSYAVLEARTSVRPDGQVIPVTGPVLISTPGTPDPEFFAGRRVAVSGVLRRPPTAQAPGLFDYREYLADRGIHRELRAPSPTDWRLLEPDDRAEPPWSDRFQAWARETLGRGAPHEDDELRLLWAMTLGWKAALVDEVEEPFLRSGTMHVFAISGLHVALIANVLVQALRLMLIPRFMAGLVALPSIWLYVAATGWQPSAVRSAVMSTIVIASWMVARPVDVLNSLATAAFAVLAWDPCQLFQAGFQLSFAVVASIGLLVPQFEDRLRAVWAIDPFLPEDAIPPWRRATDRIVRRLGADLSVSVAAWIGSVPLSACHFHLLTPSGLIANLFVVPLSSFALASSLASLACGHWLPWIGECFNHGAWFWMAGMLEVSRRCADLPYGCWQVATPPVTLVILAYLLLFLIAARIWRPTRWRRPAFITVGALAIGSGAEWQAGQVETRVGILALRGGHSVCIQTSNGTSLIDSGDAQGARTVVHPYLRTLGVNRLQELWLSHGDIRHVGGTPELLARYPLQQVGIGPIRFRSGAYRDLVQALQTRSPPLLRTVQAGETLGPWRVLHPAAADRFAQADDGSLVLQFGDAEPGILVLGDLGRPGQEQLMSRHPDLRAEIVISGVPTRGEPLCDGLLDQLAPRMVVIVDASQPATARAPAACKARLRARRMNTLFASESGSLELRRIGGVWEVRNAEGHKVGFPEPSTRRSE